MKLKNLAYLSIFSLIVLSACKKDEPEPQDDPSAPEPSAAQLNSFFDSNNGNAVQTFTIDAQAPVAITGAQGTEVVFWPNSFEDASGTEVQGNVEINLTEIYGKKDMMFLNKQTLGDNNGTLQPLESGGEFKITASQNGSPVYLKDWTIYNVEVQAPGGTNPNMTTFYGGASDDTLTWTASDSTFWTDNGTSYDMYFDSLGWINCDVFMSNPGTQTEVQVDVPTGYNNSNCAVFVSFDGFNSVTAVYGYNGTNFTTGPYYTLPEGMDVHFIALAFINNTPHAAIQGSTLTANHIEVISALNATTQAQLVTDMQNLP